MPVRQDARPLKVSDALVLRTCDEGLLVFDERQGKTSLVDHQGAGLLRAVQSTPMNYEEDLLMASGLDESVFQAWLSCLEAAGMVIRC